MTDALNRELLAKALSDVVTLTEKLAERDEKLKVQDAQLQALTAMLAKQDEKVAALTLKLAEQEAQIEALQIKLNENSQNSHKPPSSDSPSSRLCTSKAEMSSNSLSPA